MSSAPWLVASLSYSARLELAAIRKALEALTEARAAALGMKTSMTLDTYADLFDTDLDNVSEALNRAKLEQNDAKMMPRAIID